MSKHRCRVLPSNSSRRIYFPPSNEALCPSLGCPSRDEGGPAAELGLHSEGHRGGDRVRGGITVLCIETSCKDCVAGIDIVGTGMLCGPVREEGLRTVDSRGLTLAMGCTEEVLVSGLSEGSVVELVVSSMVTRLAILTRTLVDMNQFLLTLKDFIIHCCSLLSQGKQMQ